MTPAKTDPDAPAPAAVPTASEQAKAALDGLPRLFASAPERVAAYRDANDRVKFMLPVRNPIDCAISIREALPTFAQRGRQPKCPMSG